MTNKQKIQRLVDLMPEDITFEQAVYRMVLLKQVEEGLQDGREGRWIDHDELFDKLMKEDEENQAAVVIKSRAKLARDKKLYRQGRAKNGRVLHKAIKEGRK